MRLYRLTPGRFAHDMTGEGARLYGGRWSPPGIPVIHTAESVALAALECLVHQQSLSALPRDIRLVIFELDDRASITTLPLAGLPPHWDHYLPPASLQEIGRAWASAAESVALRVPSAIIPQGVERNVLVNPQHPDFNRFQPHSPAQPGSTDEVFRSRSLTLSSEIMQPPKTGWDLAMTGSKIVPVLTRLSQADRYVFS